MAPKYRTVKNRASCFSDFSNCDGAKLAGPVHYATTGTVRSIRWPNLRPQPTVQGKRGYAESFIHPLGLETINFRFCFPALLGDGTAQIGVQQKSNSARSPAAIHGFSVAIWQPSSLAPGQLQVNGIRMQPLSNVCFVNKGKTNAGHWNVIWRNRMICSRLGCQILDL